MTQKIMKQEQGRSMVEMLGTLAIIGVLSVGGIAGYTYGMNKYYANELLAGASARAVIVSSQISFGQTSSLAEFSSMKTAGGEFDGTVKEFDDGIGIKVSGVKKAVCENLIKDTEGTDIGIETEAGGEVTCGDDTNAFYITFANMGVGGGETNTEPECDPACEEGEECIGGVCAEVSGECSQNADCDEWCETNGGGVACYCKITANRLENDSACWENFTGQCAVATPRSGVTGGYTVSDKAITWWSAVNFCKAHNKSLVSLADLGITGGYQDEGWCEGSDCTGTVDWSDLQKKIGTDYCWTTDAASCDLNPKDCTSGTNNNSCYAFGVKLSSSAVHATSYYYRANTYGSRALCE